MIAQSVIFSVSLSEESSFWLKSLCDFSGQITDNYKSFCLAVLTGKASLPTPDLVHSPWIMALGTLRGLQSKPQAPWLARLFIFTFLVPSGFIWAFGQGSPSGSSAGVSWGLRRGNFTVISQSNSAQALFLSRLSSFFFPSILSLPPVPQTVRVLLRASSPMWQFQIYADPSGLPGHQSVREERTCFLLPFFLPSLQWSDIVITQLLFSLTIYVNMFLQHLH